MHRLADDASLQWDSGVSMISQNSLMHVECWSPFVKNFGVRPRSCARARDCRRLDVELYVSCTRCAPQHSRAHPPHGFREGVWRGVLIGVRALHVHAGHISRQFFSCGGLPNLPRNMFGWLSPRRDPCRGTIVHGRGLRPRHLLMFLFYFGSVVFPSRL